MHAQDYTIITAEEDPTGSQVAVLPTPSAFVARLEAEWTETFKNTSSPALRQTWQQMGECFNRQVARSVKGQRGTWQVLQGRTGTAKTLGLQTWAAMLPPPSAVPVNAFTNRAGHPGVLIVTKLIENAQGIAKTINTLARRYHGIDYDVAFDYHGKNRTVAAEDLKDWPVLICTHAAFQIAMGEQQIQWKQYHAFADGVRRCTVIDESLELIEDVKVDVNEIRACLGAIPLEVELKFPREMQALTKLKEDAEFFVRHQSEEDAVLIHKEHPNACDLTPLRSAVQDKRYHRAEREKGGDQVNEILGRLQIVLNQWAWFSSQQQKSLNTASFLIPSTIIDEGAVVLDATASTNAVYKLLTEDRVTILPRLAEPRTYRNATLHRSFGHRVGKGTMGRIAKDEAHVLVENLRRQFSPERKVFVGLSLVSEEAFDAYRTPTTDSAGVTTNTRAYSEGSGFARFDVAHYGETDGVNTFNADDVAVIFGLNYPPQERAVNLFNALRGVQLPLWFKNDVEKLRREFTISHLVTTCIQMFNRTIVRKCVSAEGDCPKADLLILLPPIDGNAEEAALAQAVEAGILREMPNIRREPWRYMALGGGGKRHMIKRSRSEHRFLDFCDTISPGTSISITSKVREEQIKASAMTWQRWSSRLQDPADPLTRAMVARGVTFTPSPGAPRPAHLSKKGGQ
jgi:hypothetical protein